MKNLTTALVALGIAATATAQAPTFSISIGLRETGFAGVPFTTPGDNGGTTGGIEWVNRDAQTLTMDGTWQQFTFDLGNDPISAFAGSTANGVLEGTHGTLEHIRILNSGGYTGPITLWIDDVTNQYQDPASGPTTVNFGTFSGYNEGDEVMFQEPGFSGSTSSNVVAGGTAGVDNFSASRSASYRVDLQFVDGAPTRWCRLTTFNARNQPNSFVKFDQGSTVTFWMRAGVQQQNLGSQGPGTAIAEMAGTGLLVGQTSTYYTSGAPAAAPGALLVSFPGLPDFPILGGNLVSGTGLIFSVPLSSDLDGRSSLSFPGTATVLDLVWQSGFLDVTQPFLTTFTNAVQVAYGQ
ncbi:MAG: hypothetical protein O3C51_04300 [Planctomycetota bacterium]|nr:hypothetical protein [Planctomycetota bacterium]